MRKILYALFVLSVVLRSAPALAEEKKIVAVPSLPEPRTLSLDLKESRLRWVGKQAIGQHFGTVLIKSGEVNTKGETLAGGHFEIDMTTITVEDVTDPKQNTKLTKHLKSDDFFSVVKYPTATLQITEVKPGSQKTEGTYDVKGDLTIKGITQPISFPLKVEIVAGKAHATGTATIDRTKWDIRYGSGQFFKGLGNKLIDDNVEISIDVSALLSKS